MNKFTLEQLEFLFSCVYYIDSFADIFWSNFSKEGGI